MCWSPRRGRGPRRGPSTCPRPGRGGRLSSCSSATDPPVVGCSGRTRDLEVRHPLVVAPATRRPRRCPTKRSPSTATSRVRPVVGARALHGVAQGVPGAQHPRPAGRRASPPAPCRSTRGGSPSSCGSTSMIRAMMASVPGRGRSRQGITAGRRRCHARPMDPEPFNHSPRTGSARWRGGAPRRHGVRRGRGRGPLDRTGQGRGVLPGDQRRGRHRRPGAGPVPAVREAEQRESAAGSWASTRSTSSAARTGSSSTGWRCGAGSPRWSAASGPRS